MASPDYLSQLACFLEVVWDHPVDIERIWCPASMARRFTEVDPRIPDDAVVEISADGIKMVVDDDLHYP